MKMKRLVLSASLTAALALAAAAHPYAGAQAQAPERLKYVLVHGAWGGGWAWRTRVGPRTAA